MTDTIESLRAELAQARAERDEHARWRENLAQKLHDTETENLRLAACSPSNAIAWQERCTIAEAELAQAREERDALRADIEWIERWFFERKWSGTLGEPSY